MSRQLSGCQLTRMSPILWLTRRGRVQRRDPSERGRSWRYSPGGRTFQHRIGHPFWTFLGFDISVRTLPMTSYHTDDSSSLGLRTSAPIPYRTRQLRPDRCCRAGVLRSTRIDIGLGKGTFKWLRWSGSSTVDAAWRRSCGQDAPVMVRQTRQT